tara:strand:- start:251 stop:397 length:147 start_codon:yes stop_codon:yes gene_type:complete
MMDTSKCYHRNVETEASMNENVIYVGLDVDDPNITVLLSINDPVKPSS